MPAYFYMKNVNKSQNLAILLELLDKKLNIQIKNFLWGRKKEGFWGGAMRAKIFRLAKHRGGVHNAAASLVLKEAVVHMGPRRDIIASLSASKQALEDTGKICQ